MKIINEKGKLFGIINLVDLVCLLLVLLVAAGVGWKLLGPKVEEAVAPTTTMTSTFRIRGAYDYTLKWLEKNDLVGEKLVMGTGYIDGTKIIDVSYESYITQDMAADGTPVEVEYSTRRDVLITVESPVAKNAAILKIGTQEVRAGRTFILKTRTFEMSVLVDSVVVE
ncbi:MAG: DUF4330 domain-containing protein [Clostridiaceae bacterium]|nr:DUF4330 domain-containing protein [Clostridiaceae bacterium]